jgi:hypothetical protein
MKQRLQDIIRETCKGNKNQECGMGGICSTHEKNYKITLWSGSLKERDQLVDLGSDRRMILKWILKKQYGSGDWIYVAVSYEHSNERRVQ